LRNRALLAPRDRGDKEMKVRPQFARVSDAMKEWSVLLGAELESWPYVTSRRMFGMTVFYRQSIIFAALPRTKAFTTPHSIAFKLHRKTPAILRRLAADPRIGNPSREGATWISREIEDEKDLKNALEWLALAYRLCVSRNNSKKSAKNR
jgi:hypothetical protein